MKHTHIQKIKLIAPFLLPGFIAFCIFTVIPIVLAIGLAFTNYSGGIAWKFVGLRNFITAFRSEAFFKGLAVTARYMIYTVVFQIIIGLACALMLYRPFRGFTVFRSILYIPNILSSVAVGLAFMLIFEPTSGIANSLLVSVGMMPSKFLAGESTALSVIIGVTVWQNFGWYMILFIGGLQGINPFLYEAARIDGAGSIKQFFSITLPGLSPVLFYAVTIAVIRGFQVFDYIFIMTGGQFGGGPAGSTSVLAFDIYKNAFVNYRFGYASAEAVILMIIIVAITVIQQHGQKKWVSYDII